MLDAAIVAQEKATVPTLYFISFRVFVGLIFFPLLRGFIIGSYIQEFKSVQAEEAAQAAAEAEQEGSLLEGQEGQGDLVKELEAARKVIAKQQQRINSLLLARASSSSSSSSSFFGSRQRSAALKEALLPAEGRGKGEALDMEMWGEEQKGSAPAVRSLNS